MRLLLISLAIIWLCACSKDEPVNTTDEPELKAGACFHYSPSDYIRTGDTIYFSNCSWNSTNFIWDFGDEFKSTEHTPKHVFHNSGIYRIKLIASNDNSSDTLLKNIVINVSKAKILSSKVWTLNSYYSNGITRDIPDHFISYEDWWFYENGSLKINGSNSTEGEYTINDTWSLADKETKLCFPGYCWKLVSVSESIVFIDKSQLGNRSETITLKPRN